VDGCVSLLRQYFNGKCVTAELGVVVLDGKREINLMVVIPICCNISKQLYSFLFIIILYYDQQMHNYFTNYHTPTCFDTIVSSSGRNAAVGNTIYS